LFSIWLSRSHILDRRFKRLTRSHFLLGCFFLIDFFSDFTSQHWVGWELSFIVFFSFFSIVLSQSHDPDCEFGKCTRVDFLKFFFLCLIEYIFLIIENSKRCGKNSANFCSVDQDTFYYGCTLQNFLFYFFFLFWSSNFFLGRFHPFTTKLKVNCFIFDEEGYNWKKEDQSEKSRENRW
jgi:hypothetical protein